MIDNCPIRGGPVRGIDDESRGLLSQQCVEFSVIELNTQWRCTMKGLRTATVFLAGAAALAAAPHNQQKLEANLIGFREVQANSTVASGKFTATLIDDTTIAYELTYSGLEGTVTQAHIHFGQRFVAAGISLWLCQTGTNKDPTNLAPTCPQEATGATTVKGNLTAANLVGPAAQG